MMASSHSSYKEKVSKFRLILNEYDKCMNEYDPAADKAILNKMLLTPVVIEHCNGVGPWSFSDATIDYTKILSGMPLLLWFNKAIMKIICEIRNQKALNEDQRNAFGCLMDYFICLNEKHLPCLKTILTEKKTESEVQAVLAIHYFQPLVHGCSYAVDKNKHGNIKYCPECKEKITFEDTSFGNRKIWHGNADIIIRRSVIKVDCTGIEEKSDFDDEDTEEENTGEREVVGEKEVGSGEPSVKQRRKGSLTSRGDSDTESSTEGSTSIIEVKLEKHMKKKAKSQALAQTIVNSFCEAKKDKSLKKQFVPSFMVTEKEVRMMMYSCEYDILLISEKLPMWYKNSLNLSTLLYTWLQLNFDKFDIEVADFPKSNFKKAVGDFAYEIYLEQVTRPLIRTKGEPQLKIGPRPSDKVMSQFGTIYQNLSTAALDI